MPGYRAPRLHPEMTTKTTTISANLELDETADQFISPLLMSVMVNGFRGHKFCLQMVHILTGFLTEAEQPKL